MAAYDFCRESGKCCDYKLFVVVISCAFEGAILAKIQWEGAHKHFEGPWPQQSYQFSPSEHLSMSDTTETGSSASSGRFLTRWMTMMLRVSVGLKLIASLKLSPRSSFRICKDCRHSCYSLISPELFEQLYCGAYVRL